MRHLQKNYFLNLLIFLLIPATYGIAQKRSQLDLTQLSLAELMKIPVITASRVPEYLLETAAAIKALPQTTIRRTGASCLAEAMRFVQGVQAARFDANKWAISSRGFNHIFSNKLLVLMDSRSLYTPVWSGVFWDSQDLYMDDLDRIEIIRGPGGSLWESNAVNGIINIVTKDAANTKGLVFNVGTGTEQRIRSGIRYGGTLRPDWSYRMYCKYQQWDNQAQPDGSPANDKWGQGVCGLRIDGHPDNYTHFSFQLLGYKGWGRQTSQIAFPEKPHVRIIDNNFKTEGATIMASWQHQISSQADFQFNAYVDYICRSDPYLLDGRYYAANLDFQHRWDVTDWYQILCGVEYRYNEDRIAERFALAILPERSVYPLISAFIQDQFSLFNKRLKLILGTKLGHNSFTGFEYQPNARFVWRPGLKHRLWGAVSRAVRTPSRFDRNSRFVYRVEHIGMASNPDIMMAATGHKKFKSEILLAYELGYRFYMGDALFVDIATYYNQYDQLRSYEWLDPRPVEALGRHYILIPYSEYNDEYGETYGCEVGLDWWPFSFWQMHTTYAYIKKCLRVHPPSTYTGSMGHVRETPPHQFTLLSSWDLPRHQELDFIVRYVDELPEHNVAAYTVFDINYRIHLADHLELSCSLKNLGYPHHVEFRGGPIPFIATEVQRSIFSNLTWRY